MGDIDVAWVPISGTWVRYAPVRRRAGLALPAPGRWEREGRPRLYLADSEQTAWAEFYRALAERGQAPGDQLPLELVSLAVRLDRVADLRTERARTAVGLPRMRPTRAQWAPFQTVGEQLIDAGAQAVIYGSAARLRSRCLCVFAAGLAGLEPVGEPVRIDTAPPPPRGLRT